MSTPLPRTTRQWLRGQGALWSTFALVWMVMVVTGLIIVARYDNAAGRVAAARQRWPAATRLVRDAHVPTLVMVAHPRCTCTRASLTELTEIMARTTGRMKAYVVFAKPEGLAGASEATELWTQASRIQHVSLVRDDDGREAATFGAATSGQIFVYSPRGELLFSGGATPSRGHAGDNVGRRAIIALAAHRQPEQTAASVFGCALRGPADQPAGDADGHVGS